MTFIRRFLCLVALSSLVVSQYGMNPVTSSDSDKQQIPTLSRIPSQTPEESVASIEVMDGFHVELVAAEPLIRSPVAIDFDEFGRAFVVEMPEYNQHASRHQQGSGAVKLLEDTNGDGRYDTATTYVDELAVPTAVACWNGGILVAAPPDIWFCRDCDGDGRADEKVRALTGIGTDPGAVGLMNSIRWRIDNQFHLATSLDGGAVVSTAIINSQTVVPTQPSSPPLDIRNRHLLWDPKTGRLQATSGGGQHGMCLDDWNLNCFVCSNSTPFQVLMYDDRYLLRNPVLQAPPAARSLKEVQPLQPLKRTSLVEPWRLLRTQLRNSGAIPGPKERGRASGFFTAASGIMLYRGDAWPEEYRGQAFVGEVSNNLVTRAIVRNVGLELHVEPTNAKQEFLTSNHTWFRPVQLANAPDGTMYVVDMSRELIEGADFIAPQILEQLDAGAGYDQGRIYRIAPDGFEFHPPVQLGDLTTTELVSFYEHPNAWHRETASRLVYQRNDPTAIAPLLELARTSPSTLARIMALYSLRSLDALTSDLTLSALKSPCTEVRQHALRLAETQLHIPEVQDAVLGLVADPELAVRYQLAFSLGNISNKDAQAALLKLAIDDGHNDWMKLAILSSVGNCRPEFLRMLLSDDDVLAQPHLSELAVDLVQQIAALQDIAEITEFIENLNARKTVSQQLVRQLMMTLIHQHPEIVDQLPERHRILVRTVLADAIKKAKRIVLDPTRPIDRRITSIAILAAAPLSDTHTTFKQLLTSLEPLPVQTAVIQTLSQKKDPDVADLLISAWRHFTPQARASALEVLCSRPDWINRILNAIEENRLPRHEIDPARFAVLKDHPDPQVRTRAEKLMSRVNLPKRQNVVNEYQSALNRQGNPQEGAAHFRRVCSACHRLEGHGQAVGPDLIAIRNRGRDAILLNILDPNREVAPQYVNYVIILKDGRVVSGMIIAESPNAITLRKADHTTEAILRIDIEAMKSTGTSFMPEGLEREINVTAMSDLLAYLDSIRLNANSSK